MQIHEYSNKGVKVATFGIFLSATLVVIKVMAGILGHSSALIADGLESALDVITSLTILSSFKLMAKSPTERFPYGYGRIEPLATLAISIFILGSGLGVSALSIHQIMIPHQTPKAYTAIILFIVIITKEIVYKKMIRSSKELQSKAMESEAWHHRIDGLTSLAALFGVLVAIIMGKGYEAADDWAALLACLVIFYNGINLLKDAVREIMDVSPNPEMVQETRNLAMKVPGVMKIDRCRIRKAGIYYFVDIHIVVDGESTVREGHRISHEVKDKLMQSNVADVLVHVEPDDPERLTRNT